MNIISEYVGNRRKPAMFLLYKKFQNNISFFQDLGVYSARGTPVPFPNTAVKLRNVDGTSWIHVGE